MAGSLFLRAFERSDRIYMAMVSRGYDGEVHSLPLPDIQPAHWVILASWLELAWGSAGICLPVLGIKHAPFD